jgi:fluoroquinolone resistance protein
MAFELSEYDSEVFRGLDVKGAVLEDLTFYSCRFADCSLNEATLKRSRFVACVFSRCDLSMVTVTDAEFSEVEFAETLLLGVNWSVIAQTRLLPSTLRFSGCTLDYATFKNLNLSGSVFEDCAAREVDFRGVKLTQGSFAGTDLARSTFQGNDLSGVDLRGAKNYQIDVRSNQVKGARASFPEVIGLLAGLGLELDV